jgi:putative ABC transport system permease protein
MPYAQYGLGRSPGFAAVALLLFALVGMLANGFFGARPLDFSSFVVAAAMLTLAALDACWLPARRAMRVDPIIALRHE